MDVLLRDASLGWLRARGSSGGRAVTNQVDDRHEQGGADDGPEDREGLTTDRDHERLGQRELASDPRTDQGADEAEHDRDDQSAAGAARDGLAEGAADRRDQQEQQESRNRHRHGSFLSSDVRLDCVGDRRGGAAGAAACRAEALLEDPLGALLSGRALLFAKRRRAVGGLLHPPLHQDRLAALRSLDHLASRVATARRRAAERRALHLSAI